MYDGTSQLQPACGNSFAGNELPADTPVAAHATQRAGHWSRAPGLVFVTQAPAAAKPFAAAGRFVA